MKMLVAFVIFGLISCTVADVKVLTVAVGELITVTSPNFPNYATQGSKASYLIKGPKGGGLRLSCRQLAVLETENCKEGYLDISNGKDFDILCGDHRGIVLNTATEQFQLNFVLFKAVGMFECSFQGLLTPMAINKEENVHLQVGREMYDGPKLRPLPKDKNVRWVFTADQGKKIDLRCTLGLENYETKLSGQCSEGSLSLNLGTGSDGKNTTRKFCKTESLIAVSSFGNKLVVDLKTGSNSVGVLTCKTNIQTVVDFKAIPSEEVDSSEYGMKPGSKQTSCNCGRANKKPNKRIIYGIDAGENEFPWAVSLQKKNSRFHFCGGSILTPYHVLSAAHCTITSNPQDVEVVAGISHLTKSKGRIGIPVERIINHEYQTHPTRRDISILITKTKIPFSNTVGPICVPKTDPKMTGNYVTAVGWGRLANEEYWYREQDQLKKTHFRVVHPSGCTKSWPTHYDNEHHSQICTWSNHTDICLGDSGGPVVWLDKDTNRYYIVGLPSLCDSCTLRLPSLHTAVHYYYGWIQKIISENNHADQEVCVKVD